MLKNRVEEIDITDIQCKYCGDIESVVKFGTRNGVQQFFCKKCGRKFTNNDALAGMRTPINQVGVALGMFYDGLSLTDISRNLCEAFNYCPSDSTVYEWIVRFTKKAVATVGGYRAKTSDTWIADETVLKIGGKNIWFWDVIDVSTRYLLASHISVKRTIGDAQKLFIKALDHTEYIPNKIITDKLAAYSDGIETVLGSFTKHVRSKGFIASPNTNIIERFHGTLKERTKVMRGMKSLETATLFTDGFLVNYNFFRPHESLKGKTPAMKAGINFPFKNWSDVVRKER